MANDFLSEILEWIFKGIAGGVSKKLGFNSSNEMLGNLINGKGFKKETPKPEPSKFVEYLEPYKGELPEGLFAFVWYKQFKDSDIEKATVFMISKNYKGEVVLNADSKSETINIGSCEQKYFDMEIEARPGNIAELTAEGKKQEIRINYDGFPACYYNGDMFLNSPAQVEKDDYCQYVNKDTIFAPGGAPGMLLGISKKEDVYEPQNEDMIYFAVVEPENIGINDKTNPKIIKFSTLEPDKKYFFIGFPYDAGRNIMGGYGSQSIVYQEK